MVRGESTGHRLAHCHLRWLGCDPCECVLLGSADETRVRAQAAPQTARMDMRADRSVAELFEVFVDRPRDLGLAAARAGGERGPARVKGTYIPDLDRAKKAIGGVQGGERALVAAPLLRSLVCYLRCCVRVLTGRRRRQPQGPGP